MRLRSAVPAGQDGDGSPCGLRVPQVPPDLSGGQRGCAWGVLPQGACRIRVVCLCVLGFSGIGSSQVLGAVYPSIHLKLSPTVGSPPTPGPGQSSGSALHAWRNLVQGGDREPGVSGPLLQGLHALLVGDHQPHSLSYGRLPSKAWRMNTHHHPDSCVNSGACSPCSCGSPTSCPGSS